MTRQQITQSLIARGTIVRQRVNRYTIVRTYSGYNFGAHEFTRDEILEMFANNRTGSDSDWYLLTREPNFPERFRVSDSRPQLVPDSQAHPQPVPVFRTISRDSYHSNGSGTGRYGIDEALRAIPADADGVKRSYGLEWEINRLDPQQEDKLARLLDTLPRHFTERDGSLGSSGVEIIFLPMSKAQYIDTFTKLQAFCRENRVDMNNTGAHTTFGVSNSQILSSAVNSDLQVRLNRIALAVKAASTRRAIKRVFGRDFTGYARLPSSTTYVEHSNAWSASRGTSAYELRLINWEADVNKVVNFMEATQFVFYRPFTARDFMAIFEAMGADVSEA